MDKKVIIAAFSIPLIFFLYGLKGYLFAAGEFDDLIGFLGMFVGVVAAVIAGITLFFLRHKKLQWWQGLLISAGSLLLAFGILVLISRIGIM